MFTEIHCIAKGKVQRVGYRDFIEQYAKEQLLHGWIKNCNDGSVEMVIQGTPDELKASLEVIQQGSLLARVDTLSVDWRSPERIYDEFMIISS